jgi:hypothetical protein
LIKILIILDFLVTGTKVERVDVKNIGQKSINKKARNIAKSGFYEIRLN